MVQIDKCSNRILFNAVKKLIVYSDGCFKHITLPKIHVENEREKQPNLEKPTISAFCVSGDEKYIAISTDNKQIVVFDTDFNVLKNFTIVRASNLLRFTNANSLIIADKTGDVYLYDLERTNEPVLLLGHLSVILDLLVTNSHIITCDRDEKIRVSKFPNAYNIECFCLGHEEFVISLNILGTILISASGDGTIQFWNFAGIRQGLINTNEFIDESFVKRFCQEINLDEVEVSALPIIAMQVYSCNNRIFIGISLLKLKKLLLFCVDQSNYNVFYCKHIHVGASFTFNLTEELIVLTRAEVRFYKLKDGFYVDDFDRNLKLFDLDIQFDTEDNISLLYKKRFDNVGKYIERKKARLELK